MSESSNEATAEATAPALRIVRGDPTPEELAAVTALMSAVSGATAPEAAPAALRGRWNDPAASHRQPWHPGPGAWRAAGR